MFNRQKVCHCRYLPLHEVGSEMVKPSSVRWTLVIPLPAHDIAAAAVIMKLLIIDILEALPIKRSSQPQAQDDQQPRIASR